MTVEECINLLTAIVGNIGSTDSESIESSIADLQTVITYLGTVNTEINMLNDDVTKLNDRALGLQQANNKLMREIVNGDKQKEEEKEETIEEELSSIFM